MRGISKNSSFEQILIVVLKETKKQRSLFEKGITNKTKKI
jgi:hypothetical protein